MLDVTLVDGYGTGNKAKVNGEGEIGVVVHSHPPIDETVSAFPFSQWFTDDGTSAGSNDMRVDGSSMPQKFYVSASTERDIYIKTLTIRIADQSAVLNKFGNLTALTNGLSFVYENDSIGMVTIQDEMKTNLDVIRVGSGSPPLGDGSSAFRADVSGSGADTYLPFMDLSKTFGFPWGLRLKKGTNDKLVFNVNDDLSTGMDGFDIKGFGIQI